MICLEKFGKVERVLFDTALRFYLKIGKPETEAKLLAFKDVKAKMDIADDEWVDITTGKKINYNF
jgi:hypothetical protein